MRADNIGGPWVLVTADFGAAGGVRGVYEDPYLFIDANDHYHLLFHVYETGEPGMTCHNSTVSAHLFSLDGFRWHTTSEQPYTAVVALSDGTTMTLATRERPKLFFDAAGTPTHLFNGVCHFPARFPTMLSRMTPLKFILRSSSARACPAGRVRFPRTR